MAGKLVFGGLMMDTLTTQKTPVTIGSGGGLGISKTGYGGVGLNMVNCLKRLGSIPDMACVIGEDLNGTRLRTHLNDENIGGIVITMPEEDTATYHAIFDANGELILGVAAKEIYTEFNPSYLSEYKNAFLEYKTWVLDSSFTPEIYQYLNDIAPESQEIFLSICGSSEATHFLPILGKATGLFCNAEEIRTLASHFRGGSVNELEDAIRIVSESGVRSIFVTDGANGAYVLHKGKQKHFPAPEANVACTNGAGDAFCAATIDALTHGQSLEVSVESGLKAAKLQVEGKGDQVTRFFASGRKSPRYTYNMWP